MSPQRPRARGQRQSATPAAEQEPSELRRAPAPQPKPSTPGLLPKGESLTYRYWTIPRVNPAWFIDPKLGALLLRYDEYRAWWDRQFHRGGARRSSPSRAPLPPSLQAEVVTFVNAPVPRPVELLRRHVVNDPLFIERSSHEGLAWSYEVEHRAGKAKAIYDFAMVDPDARSAVWVSKQEGAWKKSGEVWRLRRFDSAIRARRGGRTSRDELRSLVQRDQRIFAAFVEAVENGASRVGAIVKITHANAGVTDSVVKKICREYLPVYAVACAVDRPSGTFFSDLMGMADRL